MSLRRKPDSHRWQLTAKPREDAPGALGASPELEGPVWVEGGVREGSGQLGKGEGSRGGGRTAAARAWGAASGPHRAAAQVTDGGSM